MLHPRRTVSSLRRTLATAAAVASTIVAGCSSPSAPGSESTGEVTSALCTPSTPNQMTYHCGPVMTDHINIYYIYYGTWSPSDQAIATDFASNISSSPWWGIAQSYSQADGTPVAKTVTFAGSTTDNLSHGTVLSAADPYAIVSNAISSGQLPADSNAAYVVMGASGVTMPGCNCLGFHDHEVVAGTDIRLAWVQFVVTSPPYPNGSATDGMMTVLAHELAELTTDPDPFTGWTSSTIGEIGDACSFRFGKNYALPNGAAANEHLGSHDYLIQSIWVNGGGGYCAVARWPDENKPCTANTDCPSSGLCTSGTCATPSCHDGLHNGDETDVDCGGVCGGCPVGKMCQSSADCPTNSPAFTCFQHICGKMCSDGIKDGNESDVDCGGGCPTGCALGRPCNLASDCATRACLAGTCVPPTCEDGQLNGSETAKDCGGPVCAACAAGLRCKVNGDCASNWCALGACQTPTCSDTLKDGWETDVDCGGGSKSGCAACAQGKDCSVNADCSAGACSGGICQAPTCGDGIQDGNETGVDCGGSCRACNGAACSVGTDCMSRSCPAGVCIAPTCSDGILNGSETAKDCGGPLCPSCAAGLRCKGNGDCQSNWCALGACQTPTCSDTLKDGWETDVDCGGGSKSGCAPCAQGKQCIVNADCAGGDCSGGICQPPLCVDGIQDGNETGVDCGGSCKACSGAACSVWTDCASRSCQLGVCVAPTCSDGILNGLETAKDCGGPACTACPAGLRCKLNGDCQSNWCALGACQTPTCTDTLKDGWETGVDCGGGAKSGCGPCGEGQPCATGTDCESNLCVNFICH